VQLDADLEPDAAVPVERDVTARLDALRSHRFPDQAAALGHEAGELRLARLAADHRERHAVHALDLHVVRGHGDLRSAREQAERDQQIEPRLARPVLGDGGGGLGVAGPALRVDHFEVGRRAGTEGARR
jgi:hypothetical protein